MHRNGRETTRKKTSASQSLWIDANHFRGDDETLHCLCTLAVFKLPRSG